MWPPENPQLRIDSAAPAGTRSPTGMEFVAAICVGASLCDSFISLGPFIDIMTDVYFYYSFKGYMQDVHLPRNKYDTEDHAMYAHFPSGDPDDRPKSEFVALTENLVVFNGLMDEGSLGVLACSCIAAPEADWEPCCMRQVRLEENGRDQPDARFASLAWLELPNTVRRVAASRSGELLRSDLRDRLSDIRTFRYSNLILRPYG